MKGRVAELLEDQKKEKKRREERFLFFQTLIEILVNEVWGSCDNISLKIISSSYLIC
jgi:hypothetical protein